MKTGNKPSSRQLALVHVAKKQLGLSEEEYREILKSHGGVESAKFLDDWGVDRVLRFFHTLGFKEKRRVPKRDLTILASKSQHGLIYGLMKDLGWSQERLNGFVDRMTAKDYPEELTKREASMVIEGLKAMRDRNICWN
jgi:hypothetical protein